MATTMAHTHTAHTHACTPNQNSKARELYLAAAGALVSHCCRKVFMSLGMVGSTAVTSTTPPPSTSSTPTRLHSSPLAPRSQNCTRRSFTSIAAEISDKKRNSTSAHAPKNCSQHAVSKHGGGADGLHVTPLVPQAFLTLFALCRAVTQLYTFQPSLPHRAAMSEKKIVGILPNNYVHVLDLVSVLCVQSTVCVDLIRT